MHSVIRQQLDMNVSVVFLCILLAAVLELMGPMSTNSLISDVGRGAPSSIFKDASGGASIENVCLDPERYLLDKKLGRELAALVPSWKRLALQPMLLDWNSNKTFKESSSKLCRTKLYLILCGEELRSRMHQEGSHLKVDSLYEYNLEVDESPLHEARVWDTPYVKMLQDHRDLLRGLTVRDGLRQFKPTTSLCTVHISFLIMCHNTNLERVTRLIKRLTVNPCHSVVLHVDRGELHTVHASIAATVENYKNAHIMKNRIRGTWGGVSLVRMEILGLMEALRLHPNTDFIVNLSSDDYPIKSDEHIHRFLRANKYRSFVHIEESSSVADQPIKPDSFFIECHQYPVAVSTPRMLRRNSAAYDEIVDAKSEISNKESDYEHGNMYSTVFNSTYRIQQLNAAFLENNGQSPRYSIGSQWWMLTNEAAFHIVSSHQVREQYHLFKYLHIPDETFFQTVFLSDEVLRGSYVPKNMRYAKLEGGRCSAVTEKDVPKLVLSPLLFARKFVNSSILQQMDLMLQATAEHMTPDE